MHPAPHDPRRVVVVGNGVAGTAAARLLGRSGAVETMLVGPGLPYDRPPLSKRALARGVVPYLADADGLAQDGVVHVDGHVRSLDAAARVLEVAAHGTTLAVPYDRLIWATGLAPWRPPVPGIGVAHDPQTATGMLELHASLATGPQRVVVLGAGLVGTETAGTLARLGHDVALVDAVRRPLDRLGGAISAAAASTLRLAGVRLALGEPVARIERGSRALGVHAGDEVHVADVVVCCAGARPTLPPVLAGPDGLAAVDGDLGHPDVPGVHVVGDLAVVEHPRFGRIRVPHWDHARASGEHAARAILGADDGPYVRDPYWFSDIAGLRIQVVGHLPAAHRLEEDGDLLVGTDEAGLPVAVVLIDAASRLRDARALLAAVPC